MIRNRLSVLLASAAAAGLMLSVGCEWSGGGGSDSFNSSQGAGVNVNYTGVYDGNLGGGRAVSPTSAGNITRLTITQSGNTLQVRDNQGSTYSGTVGSPGAVSEPTADGTFPPGATVVESQISFSGKDGVSAKDIEFVGVVHLVSVVDIKGSTTVKGNGSTNSSTRTSADAETKSYTTSVNDGSNTVVTTVVTIGVEGDPFFQQTTTVVTIDNASGAEVGRTVSTTKGSSSGSSSVSGSTATTVYQITENNTQLRLEGSWVEKGGVVGSVDALSSGGIGTVVFTTQTPAETP